jgi:Carboxypeptidase regulatory-like domain
MKLSLAFPLLLASLLAYSQTNDGIVAGRIRGTVTDRDGNPASGATVSAVPQFSTFESLVAPTVKTDAKGRFYFHEDFQLGTYKLYARKEADAYPDRSSTFYANPNVEAATVDLTEDNPSVTVDVNLGEKAAALVGRIIDANTGTAVKATLFFFDDDWNNNSVSANGKYRALLPSDKDLILMVGSPGYQYFITSLHLQAGQEMQMDISIWELR